MTDTTVDTPPPEALSDKQVEWILGLTKAAEQAVVTRKKAEARYEMQEKIEKQLGALREQISKDQEYALSLKPDSLKTLLKYMVGMNKRKSKVKDGSPMDEVDTVADVKKATKGLSPEQVQKLMQSLAPIAALSEEMRNMTVDGIPVYERVWEEKDENGKTVIRREPDDEMLAVDLWRPLAREGIIPENVIPARYSEVTQTFNAANALYDERLQEYSKSLTTADKIMNVLNPAVDITSGALKATSGFMSMTANIQAAQAGVDNLVKSGVAKSTDEARKIVDLTNVCLTSSRDLTKAVIQTRDAYAGVDAANAILGGILKQTVGADISKAVTGAVSAATKSVKAGQYLAEGNIDGMFEAFGEAIAGGLALCDNKKVNGGVDTGGAYAQVGLAISTAFKGAGVVAAAAKGDPQRAFELGLAALMQNMEAVAKTAIGKQTDKEIEKVEENEELTDKEKETETGILESGETSRKGDVSSTSKDIQKGLTGALGMLAEKKPPMFDREALAELEKKADENMAEELEKVAKGHDPEFEAMLVYGFSEPTDDPEKIVQQEELRLHTMEKLIATLKKHQMAFTLAKQIVTGGTGFVASILPAAGLVAAGAAMMFNLAEAANHTRHFVIWHMNQKDASKAKTVQLDAMLNRYGLQRSQMLLADARVALNAVDIVGQAVKTAGGQAAPVGLAISAAAKATEALMDVAYKIKTEAEMLNAWRLYKKALREPDNRRAAREALRTNPTLSKYAMAYGACTEKNPVAMRALKRCGIDEYTLANPSTNVGNVVTFLETLYKEDPILLKAVTVKEDWHPGPIEPTVKSFQLVYIAATDEKKKVGLVAGDVSKITATLKVFEAKDKPVATLEDTQLELQKKIDLLGVDYRTEEDPTKKAELKTEYDDASKKMLEDAKRMVDLASEAVQAIDAAIAALEAYKPEHVDGGIHDGMADVRDALIGKLMLRREIVEPLEQMDFEID